MVILAITSGNILIVGAVISVTSVLFGHIFAVVQLIKKAVRNIVKEENATLALAHDALKSEQTKLALEVHDTSRLASELDGRVKWLEGWTAGHNSTQEKPS